MAKGLDDGTMNIICAKKEGDSTVFVNERNAFIEIDSTELAKNMLDSAEVYYIEKGDKFYVLGEDAFRIANVFGCKVRRPMKHGIISSEERESIPVIEVIINNLVGPPEQNEMLCISSPANPIDSNVNVLYHKKTVEALAQKMHYNTHVIDEGLAVVHSELSESATGVGISIGAGLTNVTVAYMATPIVSFSISRGGDWIDEQVAVANGTAVEKVTSIKENSFSLDSEYEPGSIEGALSIHYDALITYIIQNLKEKLSEVTPPDIEFPIAIAGGSAKTKGFVDLFKEKLPEKDFPLKISTINVADEPINAVARGCLIAALTKEH